MSKRKVRVKHYALISTLIVLFAGTYFYFDLAPFAIGGARVTISDVHVTDVTATSATFMFRTSRTISVGQTCFSSNNSKRDISRNCYTGTKTSDGGLQHSATLPYLSANTTYYYYVQAYLDSRITTSKIYSFKTIDGPAPDTTPPTISITSPANNSTVHLPLVITANVSDNVAISKVRFLIDNGGLLSFTDTQAPYEASFSALSVGTHVLKAVAYDTAITPFNAVGNETWSAPVTITISDTPPPPSDTTSPTITITSPQNNALVGGVVTISADAVDNINVYSVQFKVDGISVGSDTTAPYAIDWDTSTSSNSYHIITAIARDAASNSATATTTVLVSN